MSSTFSNLRAAAILGSLIVLPFVLLELRFNKVTEQNLAGLSVLFGLLWLLSTGFILIVIPILQNLRAGNRALAKPLSLLVRITTSAVILTIWTGIVMDQLPCFLGVPNCD